MILEGFSRGGLYFIQLGLPKPKVAFCLLTMPPFAISSAGQPVKGTAKARQPTGKD